MSFYGFNETRNVSGEISAMPAGAYSMKVHSPDNDIDGCQLNNVAPVSESLGNAIVMPGCGLNLAGCSGEVTGAGGDHILTNSAAVNLTPAD